MLIKVDGLGRRYVTYKRGSGFKESIKSFFKRKKVYVDAVKNVSFTVKEGDIVGILGPNGAGKSTTIKMLTGTLYPSEGTIDVMGYNPCKDRVKYVKNMGAVFGQKSQLIFDIPPVDSFVMNKAIYDIDDREYEERLKLLTELLELGDIIYRPTRVLSLGERMKCEFIMAMLHNPKIVFLDEPTIGLDVIAKQNVRKFIKEMNERGVTFILTTHDLQDVEQLAKNVIIINSGEKVFDGTITELKNTLGAKKIVEITLADDTESDVSDIEGVKLIEKNNNLQFTLEVDTEIIPINKFIGLMSQKSVFTDISIKELPMEDVIAKIYTEKVGK
ncbi:MAG: ATP-binding cassette domain-containing protein [Lachnospiraceae bacterium]|nr:ATP-binding cassette domain-containing protein [Lachnospiraceae bacterium]